MLRPRIIPCLLIHEGGLVKTVGFREPKYVGDPINAVKIFNEKKSDELVVFDIDVTAQGAEPDYRMIADLAAECRMPLCYGGGVRSVEQAKRIVGLGVEKVSLGAAAVERPKLIAEISEAVGSQSVVVTIDYKRKRFGRGAEVWSHNAARSAHRAPLDFAAEVAQLGAGEIVLNAIDLDGRMQGYDLEFARALRTRVDVPITVLGGAGSLQDMRELFKACGIVGAAAGSLFVFKGQYRAVLINYPDQVQKDALFAAVRSN